MNTSSTDRRGLSSLVVQFARGRSGPPTGISFRIDAETALLKQLPCPTTFIDHVPQMAMIDISFSGCSTTSPQKAQERSLVMKERVSTFGIRLLGPCSRAAPK